MIVTNVEVIIGHHQQNCMVMVTNEKVISEVFGHHHQHHHSWYPTYCNIKGYLYTRGKLNLNICTKGCYFQFQCSVSIFKILTKNMFRFEKYFLVPVNWAIKGDLLKYPSARYCTEGVRDNKLFDMSCCPSLTCQVFYWYWTTFSAFFGLLHAFVPCFHSCLDVNLPHTQTWMSCLHVHESI